MPEVGPRLKRSIAPGAGKDDETRGETERKLM
jgi:hypothetical protein